MTDVDLRLIPCFEAEGNGGGLQLLDGAASDTTCDLFIRTLLSYGAKDDGPEKDLASICATLVHGNGAGILPGGLVAQTTDGVIIEPGCCCGLEAWRDWQDIQQHGPSPWLGHDPSPWIDTSGTSAILYADETAEAEKTSVSYNALRQASQEAEKDFQAFRDALRVFLRKENIDGAEALVDRISHWFSIDRKQPPTMRPDYVASKKRRPLRFFQNLFRRQ